MGLSYLQTEPTEHPVTLGAIGERIVKTYYTNYGDQGVFQTVKKIKDLVHQYNRIITFEDFAKRITDKKQIYDIITTAQHIVMSVPERDKMGEINAIHQWVMDHFRYTEDPYDVELLNDPAVMLEDIQREGKIALDCDGATILESVLLSAIGFPIRFVVIGPQEQYKHIYLQAGINTPQGYNWVSLDPIVKNKLAGWEANIAGYKKKQSN